MNHRATILASSLLVLCRLPAAGAMDEDAEKAAIQERIASYAAAFNARDAAKLAEHWLPNAVYTNPISGIQVEGREAIAKEFETVLEEREGARLAVDVESIRFISPNVAVETGKAKVVSADGQVDESRYTAIHVKHDGQWYLDRVAEEEMPDVLTHYPQLKDLEWMVGTWVDADQQSRVTTTCQWTRNKNYLVRWFDVTVRDRVELAGVQIIGWDPSAEQIRSWVFDSDGGFAEGRWTKKGDRWFVTIAGTLPDGQKASSVNIITRVDENRFKWESVQRTVGGALQPNIDEVTIVRVPPLQGDADGEDE